MAERERRIFVYTAPESSGPSRGSRGLTELIRAWVFSPIGLICSWILALGMLAPATAVIIFTLREEFVLLILGFGTWLVLGLIVIHWWIPSAREANARTEGIAAAGWHIALTVGATGLVGWLTLFQDGINAGYTLADTRPVIAAGGILTLLFGALVIWFRGHPTGRTVRYGVIAGSLGTIWMALWLVAAHGGLLS